MSVAQASRGLSCGNASNLFALPPILFPSYSRNGRPTIARRGPRAARPDVPL